MEYYLIDPKLADRCARSAASKIGWHRLSDADVEDMAQEAAIAIWQVAEKARDERLCFVAGRYAATRWFIHIVLAIRWKGDLYTGKYSGIRTFPLEHPDPDFDSECCTDPELMYDPYIQEPDYRYLLTPERKQMIHAWLRDTGPWLSEQTADKAMEIIELLLAGYSTTDIAERLGHSPRHINRIRTAARQCLENIPGWSHYTN